MQRKNVHRTFITNSSLLFYNEKHLFRVDLHLFVSFFTSRLYIRCGALMLDLFDIFTISIKLHIQLPKTLLAMLPFNQSQFYLQRRQNDQFINRSVANYHNELIRHFILKKNNDNTSKRQTNIKLSYDFENQQIDYTAMVFLEDDG